MELDREHLFARLRDALEAEIRGTEQALLSNLFRSFEESWHEAQRA